MDALLRTSHLSSVALKQLSVVAVSERDAALKCASNSRIAHERAVIDVGVAKKREMDATARSLDSIHSAQVAAQLADARATRVSSQLTASVSESGVEREEWVRQMREATCMTDAATDQRNAALARANAFKTVSEQSVIAERLANEAMLAAVAGASAADRVAQEDRSLAAKKLADAQDANRALVDDVREGVTARERVEATMTTRLSDFAAKEAAYIAENARLSAAVVFSVSAAAASETARQVSITAGVKSANLANRVILNLLQTTTSSAIGPDDAHFSGSDANPSQTAVEDNNAAGLRRCGGQQPSKVRGGTACKFAN